MPAADKLKRSAKTVRCTVSVGQRGGSSMVERRLDSLLAEQVRFLHTPRSGVNLFFRLPELAFRCLAVRVHKAVSRCNY